MRGLWRIYLFLERRLGCWNHEFWRSAPVRRYLKAAPYFFQNYLTGALLRRDLRADQEFQAVPLKWGEIHHAMQTAFEAVTPPHHEDIRALLSSEVPVFKLTVKRYQKAWETFGLWDLLRKRMDNVCV